MSCQQGAREAAAEPTRIPRLDGRSLDLIFRHARTHVAWRDVPVSDEVLEELYALTSLGPTSANCFPVRVAFLRSPAAKERLRPALSQGNLAKTLAAPVTAIVAYDTRFCARR